jgi:hypothetical protein
VQGDVIIEGFEKIHLNQDSRMAIGIAGVTAGHTYLQTFKNSACVDTALEAIISHAQDYMQLHERQKILQRLAYDQNEGIASFFDEREQTYFACHYGFSPINSFCRLHACPTNKAVLLRAGLGASALDQFVGASQIERFTATINTIEHLDDCLQWAQHVCAQLSAANPYIGRQIAGVISTRQTPRFVKLDRLAKTFNPPSQTPYAEAL